MSKSATTEKHISLFICDEASRHKSVQVTASDAERGNLKTLPELRIFGQTGVETIGKPPSHCIYGMGRTTEEKRRKKTDGNIREGKRSQWITVYCCGREFTKPVLAYFSDRYDILRVATSEGNWISIELARKENAEEIMKMGQPILVAPRILVFVKMGRHMKDKEEKQARKPWKWTDLKDPDASVKPSFAKTIWLYLRDFV